MSYTATERRRAIAWKSTTETLPDAARLPGGYGAGGRTTYSFCLPPGHAGLNLLPEVRDRALALFAELGIPWHAGVLGGPSNHLLSSQVQCVNALGQMVHDPRRIVHAFGDLLQIGDVLPIEPDRHLTFEYIGPTDYFGEAPGAVRTRGARCTSVDAAFLHRRRDGVRELVLIEWKYTESYALRRPEPDKDAVRWERYGTAWGDVGSPVRNDLLPFGLVLDEPFYQLVRQQLLAHELEKAHAHGAESVRVLHVLPPGNTAYQRSLVRPEHRELGRTVSEVWQRLLRASDRFVPVDPAVFLDPRVTSAEYVRRYG